MNEKDIKKTVDRMFELLGVLVTDIEQTQDEKLNSICFRVTSDESHLLIGERGANLLALNHLLKKMVDTQSTKASLESKNFFVDVNNYQQKRIDELRARAVMLAERARFFKRNVEMDPMSSYERMIVHSEFTDIPDINTESEGQGRDRRIVLRFIEQIED